MRFTVTFTQGVLAATTVIGFLLGASTTRAETRSPEAIEAQGPLAPLKGTLQRPQNDDAPVALIIPGSGPTDRDGNSPLGIKTDTYKLLAAELAARGVATVRIDKRGMFGSLTVVANGDAVTIGDYAADSDSWINAIRTRTGQSCAWIIGHSEGGLVAMAALRKVTNICGFVFMAAPGRPLGSILRDQLKANPANAPILPSALDAIDRLEAGMTVDTTGMHPALMGLFRPSVQRFLISMLALDPARLLADFDGPVLVLQGGRDIQVSAADAELLAGANRRARLVVLPTMNHVLKDVMSDDRAANLATYGDPKLPLAAGVADIVSHFIIHGRLVPK
jgi:hypothetical protein